MNEIVGQPAADVKFACPSCNGEVVAVSPEMLINNSERYSQVMFVHPDPAVCPGCGQHYRFAIHSVPRISLGWMPCTAPKGEKKEDDDLIKIPDSLDMAKIKKFPGRGDTH